MLKCKMKRAEVKQIEKTCYVACHESVPSFEVVSVGSIEKGYRELCSRCFNTEMAQLNGLTGFEHLDLKPVTLTDADGRKHEFHFRTHLFGPGVALDAFEIRGGHPSSYQFQIIGEPSRPARFAWKINRKDSARSVTKTSQE